MVFSALLAEEYELSDISLTSCSPGRTNLPAGRQVKPRNRI
jgi:hypothetical protein